MKTASLLHRGILALVALVALTVNSWAAQPCPQPTQPKVIPDSAYTVQRDDDCWWIVPTTNGPVNIKLPAPGLIFYPGFTTTILPLSGAGVLTFTGLPDDAGKLHLVNGQTALTLLASAGATIKVLQDSNWYVLPYGGNGVLVFPGANFVPTAGTFLLNATEPALPSITMVVPNSPQGPLTTALTLDDFSHLSIGNMHALYPWLTCDPTESMSLCSNGPLIRIVGDDIAGDRGTFGAQSARGAEGEACFGCVVSGGWKSFVEVSPAEINYTTADGGKGGPTTLWFADVDSCCGPNALVADSITAVASTGSGYALNDLITLKGGSIVSGATVTGTTNSTTAVTALSANVLLGPYNWYVGMPLTESHGDIPAGDIITAIAANGLSLTLKSVATGSHVGGTLTASRNTVLRVTQLTSPAVQSGTGIAQVVIQGPNGPGDYTVAPPNSVAQLDTTGIGSGATFTMSYAAPADANQQGSIVNVAYNSAYLGVQQYYIYGRNGQNSKALLASITDQGSTFNATTTPTITASSTQANTDQIAFLGTVTSATSSVSVFLENLNTTKAGCMRVSVPGVLGLGAGLSAGGTCDTASLGMTLDTGNNAEFTKNLAVDGNLFAVGTFRITQAAPLSGDACTAGQFTVSTSFLYTCAASGTWKRVAVTGGY